MRPVKVRTLRRSFLFPNQLGGSPLWFLATEPTVESEAPEPTILYVEERHGFFRVRLPSGPMIEGSLRNLARAFDSFIPTCAVADERDAISVPAALLTSPSGRRVAFIGSRNSGKTSLALDLASHGWRFEGDERLFIRPDGIVAHPRTLRLTRSLIQQQPRFTPLIKDAPVMDLLNEDRVYTVDPNILGQKWVLTTCRVDAIFFIGDSKSRLCSIRRISLQEGFGLALHLCTMPSGVTARALGLLRSTLMRAPSFHLELGAAEATTSQIDKKLFMIQAQLDDSRQRP